MLSEFHLHPIVVHFPIALFIAALGFEIFSLISRQEKWHETAWQLFFVAVLSAALAVLTGLWEVERLHLNHPVLNNHRTFALTTFTASVLGLVVNYELLKKKSPQARKIFQFFLCLIVLGIVITSFFGGEMVYEYGVGVAP